MQTILLVDDDPVFRKMMSSSLFASNFHVVEANDGLEALQCLRDQVPDLMICDLNMPIVNGMELVEEVTWQYPLLPIIVVSATGDMKDVARVLRFGIKDFFTKPVSQLNNFIQAVKTTLEEAQRNPNMPRDFSSHWFGVDPSGYIAQERELYWHLNHLKENTVIARDLLHALQPDTDTQQGNWRCHYLVLQPSEDMPLVFDYAWLRDGRFAFYLVDSSYGGNKSVGTTLLVRALFNDFLRIDKNAHCDLKDFAKNIEKGIHATDCTEPLPAILGIANMVEEKISLLSAGLSSRWHHEQESFSLTTGDLLGNDSHSATIEHLPMRSGGDLTLSQIGVRSFKLMIENKRETQKAPIGITK